MFFTVTAGAQNIKYSGEAEFTVLASQSGSYNSADVQLQTTHGVLLYNKAFVGLGAGYCFDTISEKATIPVYVDSRYFFGEEAGSVKTFAGGRFGCKINEAKSGLDEYYGIMADIYVGVKINNLVFKAGYEAFSSKPAIQGGYIFGGIGIML